MRKPPYPGSYNRDSLDVEPKPVEFGGVPLRKRIENRKKVRFRMRKGGRKNWKF